MDFRSLIAHVGAWNPRYVDVFFIGLVLGSVLVMLFEPQRHGRDILIATPSEKTAHIVWAVWWVVVAVRAFAARKWSDAGIYGGLLLVPMMAISKDWGWTPPWVDTALTFGFFGVVLIVGGGWVLWDLLRQARDRRTAPR